MLPLSCAARPGASIPEPEGTRNVRANRGASASAASQTARSFSRSGESPISSGFAFRVSAQHLLEEAIALAPAEAPEKHHDRE